MPPISCIQDFAAQHEKAQASLLKQRSTLQQYPIEAALNELDPLKQIQRTLECETKQLDRELVSTMRLLKEFYQEQPINTLVHNTEATEYIESVYQTMLGLRLLVGQNTSFFQLLDSSPEQISDPEYVYGFHRVQEVPVKTLVRYAIEDTIGICVEKLGSVPPMHITSDSEDGLILTAPTQVIFVVTELLKNSCKSVTTKFPMDLPSDMPPITIHISKPEDGIVSLSIRDEGVGISAEQLKYCFTYFYSATLINKKDISYFCSTDFGTPLEGIGIGLPLSRLYTRFMGGDLTVESVEGQYTQVSLTMNTRADNSF